MSATLSNPATAAGVDTSYDKLVLAWKEVSALGAVNGLLNWDQETYMPPKGAASRADMCALVSGVSHDKLVADSMGELLEKAEREVQGLGAPAQANVREIGRAFRRERKLPKELVTELSKTTSLSMQHWQKAKKENKFEEFAPWLEKIIGLKRKVADAVGFTTCAYDALLDEYEPAATAEALAPMFAGLKEALVPLVAAIAKSDRRPDATILTRPYPVEKQKEFSLAVIGAMGFDLEAGRLDVSAHPFCSGFSPKDVRLTTRFQPNDMRSALFGCMHEAGHGLYEQGLDPAHEWTPMASAVSLGIHESQSRLWENLVGRSRPFWTRWYPKLLETFPDTLAGTSFEEFYFAINDVRPSMIRVEADEVTYNLHILLRFELEQELLSGKVSISDLPSVWNARMEQYLGIKPATDSEGCLQDIHWSFGLFGYFPTYTLGNLYASQIFAAAQRDMPDLNERIAGGDMIPLRRWLEEKVHRKGMLLRPADLVTEVTGEAPTADHFTRYLTDKFGALYGV